MIVQIYVEVVVFWGISIKMLCHFVQQMQVEFKMRMGSELTYFLDLSNNDSEVINNDIANKTWSRSLCVRMCVTYFLLRISWFVGFYAAIMFWLVLVCSSYYVFSEICLFWGKYGEKKHTSLSRMTFKLLYLLYMVRSVELCCLSVHEEVFSLCFA